MSYHSWFISHGKKHREIVDRLERLSEEEIVDYFCFDNMVKNEPEFCPLYSRGKKCHDIDDLNCYLCACPYFRFDDDGFKIIDGRELKSYCSIDAKDSSTIEHEKIIHQDCSACTIPHKKSFILKHFSRDWFKIMREVTIKTVSP